MIKKLSMIFFFCLVTAQYDYTLEDINSSSDTYGQQISPSFFKMLLHFTILVTSHEELALTGSVS